MKEILNTPLVQIFVLTRNRPKYACESVDSILNQTFDDFEVIVSDNSTNDETESVFKKRIDPRLKYIRRTPPTDSNPHFRRCVSEVSSKYFMLFHDDDILEPNFLAEAMDCFNKHENLAAVASLFSRIDINGEFLPFPFSGNGGIRILHSTNELFRPYLNYGSRFAAYCSYMYKKEFVDQSTFDLSHGRKYSDVSTIAKTLHHGPIAWIEKPLVRLRHHPGQDSQSPDLYGRLSLLRFIYSNSTISRRSPEAMKYRRIAWCDWLKLNWREAVRKHPRRYFKILRIMLPYLMRNKLNP